MIKSILRTLLVSTIIGLFVLLGALWFLPSLLSGDEIRPDIEREISAITGGDTKIYGKVSVSLLPEMSFSASDINISGKKNGQFEQINISSLNIKLSAMKMLFSDIVDINVTSMVNGKEFEMTLYVDDADFIREGKESRVSINVTSPINYKISAIMSFDYGVATIKDLLIHSAKTNGNGHLYYTIAENGTQSITSELAFQGLDIDEVIPLFSLLGKFDPVENQEVMRDDSRGDQVEEQEKKPFAHYWSDAAIDFAFIKNLNIDASFKAENISFRQANIEKVNANLKVENNIASFVVDQMGIYGGMFMADGALNVNDTAKFNGNLNIDNVDISRFLTDIDAPRKANGKFTFVAKDLSAQGASLKDLVGSFFGNLRISLTNGGIEGLDVAALANRALEKINQIMTDSQEMTNIVAASANITIDKGVFTNDDLNINIPLSPIAGKGTFNLNDGWIKYRISPNIVGVGDAGLKVPVLIKGDIRDPKIKFDHNAAVIENVDQMKLLENKEVKKITDKIMNNDIGKKLLNGLLGGK